MEYVYSCSSSQRLVSWITLPPSSMRSICLSRSYSIARSIALRLAIFFISVLVPNSFWPLGLTERLTSALMEPSCILQSEIPRYCIVSLSFSRYAITSSPDLKSGSDTISRSGTPHRLKSTMVMPVTGSWTSFPASSSMWISWIPMDLMPCDVLISTWPFLQIGK